MSNARSRIVDAALELLSGGGLETVSIEAIRQRAGVSNGSFFHHFPTRADLVAEIYLDGLCAYHAHIEQTLAADPSAAVGVSAAIHAHLDWVVHQRAVGRLVIGDDQPGRLGDDGERRRLAENDRFASVLDRWRQRLVETGQVREVSNEMFIAQIVGPARILARTWLLGHTTTPPSDYAEELIEASLRALGAHPEAAD